jgi:hypothetical protein
MQIDAKSKTCPVCNYEFREQNPLLKWVAIILALIFLITIIVF